METLVYQLPVENPENGFKVKVFKAEVFSGFPRNKTGDYYIVLEQYSYGNKDWNKFWIHHENGRGMTNESDTIKLAKKWHEEESLTE